MTTQPNHPTTPTRALVTGGAGFIGAHLVQSLLKHGHDVTVVDNLSSTPTAGRPQPPASLHNLDIADPSLADVFAQFRPEIVYHLAAQVSVARSMREPEADVHTNILGGINVLQQCARFGVKRIVLFSTGGALYGEPQYLPCDENHPIKPLSVYGASKHALEQHTRVIAEANGIEYTILRPGNVYGPGQDPHGEAGVIAIFTQKMRAGEEVTIYGDGTQERDYIHVDDVVAAATTTPHPNTPPSATYNIGTGVPTTVNQIFSLIAEQTGYTRSPAHAPERPGDVHRIYLNIEKVRDELGWTPQVNLRDGIHQTIAALPSP